MQNETKVCFDGSTSSEETERKSALGECDILKKKPREEPASFSQFPVKSNQQWHLLFFPARRLAFGCIDKNIK